jgi:hypothetical protein
LEKEVIGEIKGQKKKEKEKKKTKHVIKSPTIAEKTIQRLVEKCVRVASNLTEFASII